MLNPTSPMAPVPVWIWEGKTPTIEMRKPVAGAKGLPNVVRKQAAPTVPAVIPFQSKRATEAARCKIPSQRESDPVTRPVRAMSRRHKNDPSDPGLAVLGCIQPSALSLRARPGDRSPSTDLQKLERACPTWG